MSRKSKPQKTYSGTIDYGDTYQYKDAKYWVYLRKRSSNQPIGKIWQIRIKIKNHPDLRKSSGTESFETAKDKAKEMIFESFYKIETGHKIKSRKFKEVSKDFLDDIANNPKTIPSKLKKFTSVADNFFNPFFGDYPMESINEKVIYDYKKWRRNYWKSQKDIEYTYVRNGQTITSNKNYLKDKPLSLSSMQKEDSILRQILELGRLSGDISSNKVVKVKSESFKTNRRPSFTNAEWKGVLKASRYRSSEERLWENKKDKSKKTDYINGATLNQRKLLHEFITFMVGSGLRTTEAMNLKWSDITHNEIVEEVGGKFQSVESCKISVSGKSKKRKCDPQPYVREILERVKVRQFEFSRENGFKFAAKKEYVWSDENGNKIDRFNKSFTKLLESCDLLYDDHGEKRVIGSLRHTYGTFRKNLGEVDSYELAIQMGTSPEMINKHYVHSDDYDRSTAVTRVKKSEVSGAKKKKKKVK